MIKNTTRALLLLFDCAVHFVSKTPSVVALSSADRELYAIGTEPENHFIYGPSCWKLDLWASSTL